eukprot:1154731-Pelagomonas_calceolata.AAC.6
MALRSPNLPHMQLEVNLQTGQEDDNECTAAQPKLSASLEDKLTRKAQPTKQNGSAQPTKRSMDP